MKLAIAKTSEELNAALAHARARRQPVVFVPTMGALHAGHASLVEKARQVADALVVVSIFVNPAQFGPTEDFSRYPRTAQADAALLESVGADVLFLPDIETIYPPGFATSISVPTLAKRWEGEMRPGHFDGVATVVARLFGLVGPDIAVFGQKDFQQLAVIQAMTRDLALGVAIIGVQTLRESDGLALSSRNRYLSPEERAIAPHLYQQLQQLAAHYSPAAAQQAAVQLVAAGFSRVDYIALVDGQTLEPLATPLAGARIVAAAWLGSTRLIDNLEVAV